MLLTGPQSCAIRVGRRGGKSILPYLALCLGFEEDKSTILPLT